MNKKVSFKTILSYFWPHVLKYKKTFFLVFFGWAGGIIGASIIKPLIYKNIIDTISASGMIGDTRETLLWLVIYLGIVTLSYLIMIRIGEYAMTFSQNNIMRELNNYSLEKLSGHSYEFFTNNFAGGLVAKSKRFVRSFETIHDTMVFTFWNTGIQLAGTFLILFYVAPLIGVFFLFWCAVYILVSLIFAKKKIKYDLARAEADSMVMGRFADIIANIFNVKIFTGRKREQDNFASVTKKESDARGSAWYFQNFTNSIQAIFMMVLEVGGIYIAIYLWLKGSMSIGTVVLIQVYFGSVFGSVWNLGKAITNFSEALTDASEMVRIFETVPSVVDRRDCEPCAITKGNIYFDKMSFRYNEKIPVFENFSLEIKAGQKVGLIGRSGSGKTTITKLLLRFFDTQGGSILVDGQNIADIKQDDLRKNIAYVPQDPILFHRSLKENIAYSNPEATDEEITESAQKAHAHEFISSFPLGYETLVGERGIKLSGGERQRVAIARAMLKKAPILILDEATSSLDSMSENYIRDSFDKLMDGKTAIVIAHRLSTVQKMDRIIVLDKGKIVEDGAHQELLDKKGMYYDLWNHQVNGFLRE